MDKSIHKLNAKNWLSAARNQGMAPECIVDMREELNLGGFSLADIGTSEEDLKQVLLDYRKREANLWLSAARNQGMTRGCIENMREQLRLGGLTLSDIGTSEEDLDGIVLRKTA